MTLATVPRYDPEAVDRRDGRAIVVGAGVAGLFTARVLADAYSQVLLLDRDPLPAGAVDRDGVPQATQPHFLLEAGRAIAADLYPAFTETLLAEGGLVVDWSNDLTYYDRGGVLAAGPRRFPIFAASRPHLESVVRRLTRRRDAVVTRPSTVMEGFELEGDRVTGIEAVGPDGTPERLGADLVVDATGRRSRTPARLEAAGFDRPPRDEVEVDVLYASVVLERPPDDRRMVVVLPSAPRTFGGGVFPVEEDRWIVTMMGLHGDHPPDDRSGFLDFADRLPLDVPATILREHRWRSGIERYPFPAAQRWRYEDLETAPAGLLVVGDAMGSFNPVYGQGMSVAALQSLQLHRLLAEGPAAPEPTRFFELAGSVLDTAWLLSVGADFGFAATRGPRPRGTALMHRYIARTVSTAHRDGRVAERLGRVLMLVEPPRALFSPTMLARVLRPW
ncbi:MAG: NAD(P)/FAD-dependent oxidoreductase [Halodesulfurarchaeum sp.]